MDFSLQKKDLVLLRWRPLRGGAMLSAVIILLWAGSQELPSQNVSDSAGDALAFRRYPPETKRSLVSIPHVPLPRYLIPIVDPIFHTTITRITDASMDILGFQANRTPKVLRHLYSKNQPWNCDGSLIHISKGYLLDGHTYQLRGTYRRPSAETVWSYKNPRKMWTFDFRDNAFEAIHILGAPEGGLLTSSRERVKSFPHYDEMYMGLWEGNLSWDDRYVAFLGRKGDDLCIMVYDIKEDALISQRTFPGMFPSSSSPGLSSNASARCKLDWCSMSPSGKYVVAAWKARGRNRFEGLEIFDRNLNFLRQLTVAVEHGDLGYDSNGNEVWVMVCCGADDPMLNSKLLYDATVAAFRLNDGSLIRVLDRSLGGGGGHVSCRNYRRPGWAYLTLGKPWVEAFAVKLDGSQTVQRFAHTHASSLGYNSEMHGVPNPEGTKVMFASAWNGDTNSSVYSYVAEYVKAKPLEGKREQK